MVKLNRVRWQDESHPDSGIALSGAERVQRWRRAHPEKEKLARGKARQVHNKRKVRVLTRYGNGKLACVKCGFDDIRALSIDHINKDEGKRVRASCGFYRWLENNNYPKGYQTLCMNCQFIKRQEDLELYSPAVRKMADANPKFKEILLQ